MENKLKINKHILYVCIAVALIALTSTTILTAQADPALPAITLTVVGADGTTQVFHENDIAAMPVTSGTANMQGTSSTWTGVDIAYLCTLVGGTTSHSTIRTIASDDYRLNFTTNADGTLHGASQQTGTSGVQSSGNLPAGVNTIILAYYINSGTGNALIGSKGPLRSAVLQTAYTSGFWFNQKVVTVQIFGGTTALTISYSPSTVDTTASQTATITGSLKTADTGSTVLASGATGNGAYALGTGIAGKAVHIYRSDTTLGWVDIGQTTTATDGSYTFNWTPDSTIANGNYQFKAVYNKDTDYFGSSAQTTSDSGLFVLPEYTFGALIGLATCFVAFAVFAAFKSGVISRFNIHSKAHA
jgi:hypothetical protein